MVELIASSTMSIRYVLRLSKLYATETLLHGRVPCVARAVPTHTRIGLKRADVVDSRREPAARDGPQPEHLGAPRGLRGREPCRRPRRPHRAGDARGRGLVRTRRARPRLRF